MYPFKLYVTGDYEEMSRKAAAKIIEQIKKDPAGLYCFAGGDTPVRTLELLVEAHREKIIDLTKAYYIELDEWAGLDETTTGSCLYYLNENLFRPAQIPQDHIHFFDAKSEDLEQECQKANDYIDHHGHLTLALLGVGENGHLGFNEPGADVENKAHVVKLSESTQQVGKKYFPQEIDHSTGISLGLKQLIQADTAILVANGEKKQEAVSKLLTDEITDQYPVTFLRRHPDCSVYIDEAAAGKPKQRQ